MEEDFKNMEIKVAVKVKDICPPAISLVSLAMASMMDYESPNLRKLFMNPNDIINRLNFHSYIAICSRIFKLWNILEN